MYPDEADHSAQPPYIDATPVASDTPTTPAAHTYTATPAGAPFSPPFQNTPPVPHRPHVWQAPAIRAFVLLALLIAGIAIGVVVTNAHAQTTSSKTAITTSSGTISLPPSVQDLQQTIITVVHTVQPSVVEVTSSDANSTAIGSGEFLTKDGYIVTNAHVVTGFSSYRVTLSNGTSQSATLVGSDTQTDLAVLKINISNAPPITLADSNQAQIGQFVVALGSPLGLQQSATFGIVSALNRSEQENGSGNGFSGASAGPILTGLIQTSAPINPGNSGGALVDLQGRLLGIPTLGATSDTQGTTVSGIGFAIPSNQVRTITTQLIQQGHVTSTGQGFLGIEGQDVTPQSGLGATQGVLVRGFANDAHGNSPAQSAGIQTGDIIIAVNGQAISSTTDLAGAVLNLAPGTTVTVIVQRGDAQQTIHVTLGERPTHG